MVLEILRIHAVEPQNSRHPNFCAPGIVVIKLPHPKLSLNISVLTPTLTFTVTGIRKSE